MRAAEAESLEMPEPANLRDRQEETCYYSPHIDADYPSFSPQIDADLRADQECFIQPQFLLFAA
jgi:hypothetical protein